MVMIVMIVSLKMKVRIENSVFMIYYVIMMVRIMLRMVQMFLVIFLVYGVVIVGIFLRVWQMGRLSCFVILMFLLVLVDFLGRCSIVLQCCSSWCVVLYIMLLLLVCEGLRVCRIGSVIYFLIIGMCLRWKSGLEVFLRWVRLWVMRLGLLLVFEWQGLVIRMRSGFVMLVIVV